MSGRGLAMPLILKGNDYQPPPDGCWSAVCVDIVDLGETETRFGPRPILEFTFELGADAGKKKNGKPFTVRRRYNKSLHAKSALTKDLASWRGRPLSQSELEGFDIEEMIDQPCRLLIVHVEREGAIYGNIEKILAPARTKSVKVAAMLNKEGASCLPPIIQGQRMVWGSCPYLTTISQCLIWISAAIRTRKVFPLGQKPSRNS
jgi:hypothetical protein